MIKRYANLSLIYAVIAMVFGVFYREITKFSGFTGKTNLSIIHAHYLVLGMMFCLLLMLLEKNFHFSGQKRLGTAFGCYQIGLNITGISFLVRGLTQVYSTELSKGMNAAISGIAGLGHIILGISLILLLLGIRKNAS